MEQELNLCSLLIKSWFRIFSHVWSHFWLSQHKEVLLESSGQRSVMLLNIPQCTDRPSSLLHPNKVTSGPNVNSVQLERPWFKFELKFHIENLKQTIAFQMKLIGFSQVQKNLSNISHFVNIYTQFGARKYQFQPNYAFALSIKCLISVNKAIYMNTTICSTVYIFFSFSLNSL